MTGLQSPYEESLNSEIILDTEKSTPQECLNAKIDLADSIIAHASQIEDHQMPKKHQFLLGERSQVRL